MRTHLFRGVMALAVLLTVSAAPALAQSVVRGKVVDAQGKPVPDATVLFEATDANRKTQTKTDKQRRFPAGGAVVRRVQDHGIEGRCGHADAELERQAGAEQPAELLAAVPRAVCRLPRRKARSPFRRQPAQRWKP